jgi:hypothetical protein
MSASRSAKGSVTAASYEVIPSAQKSSAAKPAARDPERRIHSQALALATQQRPAVAIGWQLSVPVTSAEAGCSAGRSATRSAPLGPTYLSASR